MRRREARSESRGNRADMAGAQSVGACDACGGAIPPGEAFWVLRADLCLASRDGLERLGGPGGRDMAIVCAACWDGMKARASALPHGEPPGVESGM